MANGHGGARRGAGRKIGQIGKAKKTIAEMARVHAPKALKTLADIAEKGESEAARVAASNAILDRAYGKPPQSMTLDGNLDHNHSMDLSDLTPDERAALRAAATRRARES